MLTSFCNLLYLAHQRQTWLLNTVNQLLGALQMTFYIYALHNGKIYPSFYFNGYSKKEAIAIYKTKYALKYKRNIRFYNVISGKVFN